MTRPQVLLDCDPGQDDAVALVLAGRHTELLGITTVCGNVDVGATTANALRMAQVLDLDAPVHAGADRPLLARPHHGHAVHGQTGLDGATFPALQRSAADGHAVEFLVETIRAHPGSWLVVTGPMTNAALAFRLAPDLVDLLAGVSFMGGSATSGNITATAEYNLWADPEAAAIVLGSGVRLRMAGLHVTRQVRASAERIGHLREVRTEAAAVVADLLDFYGRRYAERLGDHGGAPLHDPVAVVAVTHPELVTFETWPVEVSLRGPTRGMTVVDRRPAGSDGIGGAPVEMVMDVDVDGLFALLADTLATYA